jgi:hypothetical protein
MTTEEAAPIDQQIEELERLKRQTRRFNLWATVALATIVIVGVGAIVNSFYGLTVAGPKQDAFLAHLGGQMQRNVLPAVQRFAQPAVKRLGPVLEAEMKRLDARAPQVADVALREMSILGTNLPLRTASVLDYTVARELRQRNEQVHKLLPGVTDQQVTALMDSIQVEAQDQLQKTGDKLFNPHLNSIHRILSDLEKIEKTERVDAKQEINPWQVAFLFMDVFTQEFRDIDPTCTPTSKETK